MVTKMRGYFVPYYNEHKCDFTRPYDGILPLLEKLSESGLHFAVASNKYQEGTEQLVEKFFGKYKFVKVLGQRDGKPIKPDPEIVHEAMEGVPEITLDEVVYCGDSDVDMQTGLGAGVKTIGVTWGFRTRE
jgi:phosphoglycolate phosphatase